MRGSYRSKSRERVVKEVRELVATGAKEIVLFPGPTSTG